MTRGAFDQLVEGAIVSGPILPEPVEIVMTVPMGDSVKLIAKGIQTGRLHQTILDAAQVALLSVSPKEPRFDGDAVRFRLGIEAHRLGLAYEYDPYFSLSIARIDPLPHQLEAVYEYFLKLPRIRFLLADDPGAGKTIMAGLLLKELKTRGLVERTLIVTPANLTFQWQRELRDKFRESFQVVRGEVLRSGYGSNPWAELNQVITSVSWVSRIEDARESLLRTRWDLIVVDEARTLEKREVESKLRKLREVLQKWGLFGDPRMKLLVFTEHKDTLDYLAGDGKEGRPRGKLLEWDLRVTQIHGGMKIGDRDTVGSRIWAEGEFKRIDGAQVMVATEAAGEGINLPP